MYTYWFNKFICYITLTKSIETIYNHTMVSLCYASFHNQKPVPPSPNIPILPIHPPHYLLGIMFVLCICRFDSLFLLFLFLLILFYLFFDFTCKYLSFFVWDISLSIILSRTIQVFANGKISSYFIPNLSCFICPNLSCFKSSIYS